MLITRCKWWLFCTLSCDCARNMIFCRCGMERLPLALVFASFIWTHYYAIELPPTDDTEAIVVGPCKCLAFVTKLLWVHKLFTIENNC